MRVNILCLKSQKSLFPVIRRYNRSLRIFQELIWSNAKVMTDTLFSKIINREISADIVYEDDLCLAFRDINPQAPVHILLIPKQPIAKISDATDSDQSLLGHLLLKAGKIVREQGYADSFRLVVNNGERAGQSVFHLHVHILAGRDFSWPPG